MFPSLFPISTYDRAIPCHRLITKWKQPRNRLSRNSLVRHRAPNRYWRLVSFFPFLNMAYLDLDVRKEKKRNNNSNHFYDFYKAFYKSILLINRILTKSRQKIWISNIRIFEWYIICIQVIITLYIYEVYLS